jgi:DNA-binding transcriptional LysR family regulator
MELRHMRYFVAVAEEKNFTRAAARLRLAQPSLSRQIRKLENELGVPLLRRGRGGVTLTAAGNEYLAQARKLLADCAAAVRVTRAVGRPGQGQLLIGTVEPMMEFVAQGVGVAIIPDPFCRPAGVVFRKLEDLDLAANLQLAWLRQNESAQLKEFTAVARQVAHKFQPVSSE